MYIKTEDNEIINLNHYPRVVLYPDKGRFQLCAIIKPDITSDTVDDSYRKIIIALFENDEEARLALDDLYSSISDSRPTWDANGYKVTRQHQSSL